MAGIPFVVKDALFAVGVFGGEQSASPLARIGRLAGVVAPQLYYLLRSKAATDQAVAERRRLSELLATVGEAIITIDRDQTITGLNRQAERLFGYASAEVLGGPLDVLLPRGVASAHRAFVESFARGPEDRRLMGGRPEICGRRKDDSEFMAEAAISRLELDGDVSFTAVLRDVTELRQAETALADKVRRLRCLYRISEIHSRSGMPLSEVVAEIVRTLPTAWAEADAVQANIVCDGKRYGTAPPDNARWFMEAPIERAGRRLGTVELRWVSAPAPHVQTGFSEEDRIFLEQVAQRLADSIDRQSAEERIVRLARFDSATGLLNRASFVERLNEELARCKRSGHRFAVHFLDLDHFKDVNDSLGHPAGDLLLRVFAARLKGTVRKSDTVARFGGDEFVVLQTNLRNTSCTEVLAKKVLGEASRPYLIEGHEIRISASIGIVVWPECGGEATSILRQADSAMYCAKEDGRNFFRLHTEAMDQNIRARVALAADLRKGLEREEFLLEYQPQLDMRTGALVGLEALVRWQHPQHGILLPAGFIGVAETTGLIHPLGRWCLEEACRQTRVWVDQRVLVAPGVMAVNLSAVQLKSVGLEADIAAALRAAGLTAEWLEIELTESTLLEVSERGSECLTRLRTHGMRIAIDDFGTGFSSLAYLSRLHVDRLKIAREFVNHPGPAERAIIRAIIRMAEEIGTGVIAEGVETLEQVEFLRELGCHVMQGYLVSVPMRAEALPGWLAEHAKEEKRLWPASDQAGALGRVRTRPPFRADMVQAAGVAAEILSFPESRGRPRSRS